MCWLKNDQLAWIDYDMGEIRDLAVFRVNWWNRDGHWGRPRKWGISVADTQGALPRMPNTIAVSDQVRVF